MSAVFDIFGVASPSGPSGVYNDLGYPRNPFRESGGALANEVGPFYTKHITNQLSQIQDWVREIYLGQTTDCLALVGNIGAGKTRILRFLNQSLANFPQAQQVVSDLVLLSDTGYTRASVGGMLIAALERMQMAWVQPIPEGVLPVVWAIVMSNRFPQSVDGLLGHALERAVRATRTERDELAQLISKWLQRTPLTAAQANKTGLQRRIDWEGELVRIIAELLKLADGAGALRRSFMLVDQLEDLFRPAFSELRRSRMLTDLRGLVDEVARGCPMGVLLAWTPDFSSGSAPFRPSIGVEALFQREYAALYSRMSKRRINLPLLKLVDAQPFAQTWIDALKQERGFVESLQPDLTQIVERAWSHLKQQRILLPGAEEATPRSLLGALAQEVDRIAGP